MVGKPFSVYAIVQHQRQLSEGFSEDNRKLSHGANQDVFCRKFHSQCFIIPQKGLHLRLLHRLVKDRPEKMDFLQRAILLFQHGKPDQPHVGSQGIGGVVIPGVGADFLHKPAACKQSVQGLFVGAVTVEKRPVRGAGPAVEVFDAAAHPVKKFDGFQAHGSDPFFFPFTAILEKSVLPIVKI